VQKLLFYFTEKQKPIVKSGMRFELGTVKKILSLDKEVY
jgi:hypothetical protein